MKNVMKKLAGLLMVLSVALFAGCSDSSDRANEAPQTAKTYTVSGKISIGSAVPANVAKSIATSFAGAGTNARSATSSFDLDTYEKEAEWVAEATSVDGDDNSENDIHIFGKIDPNEKTYSFKLPQGTWTLMLALEGEYKENHVDFLFYNEFEKTVGSSNVSKNVVLFPRYSLNKNGALNLTIKDETTGSKIDNVTCELEYKTEVDEQGKALIKDTLETAIANLKKPKPFSSSDTVTIVQNDVPAGCYEATFTFKDEKDNTLYECKEIITVFSGWKTDTWLGEGAHLKNVDEVTNFVITDGDIFEVENVPDTQMVLYEAYSVPTGIEDETTTRYKYYLNNSAEANITTTSDTNSFCFDKNGNFYAITNLLESAFYITSNKSGFGTTDNPGEMYIYGDCGASMAIDKTNDFIYMWDESNHSFARITALDGTYPKLTYDPTCVDPTIITIDGANRPSGNVFVINDGIAYIADIEDGDSLALKIFTVQINQENASVTNVDYLNLDSSFRNATITDMLYQDGAVYLLVRNVSPSDFCSRGAIIRYDVMFKSLRTLGWSNTKLSGKFYACSNNGLLYDADTSNQERKPVTFEYNFMPVFAPSSSLKDGELTLSTEAFYGPSKFIAIKPKKLVIADDGLAFYTDENGAFKYKNVNRVVTIDLESFAIDSSETDAKFEADETGSIKNSISIANTPENFYRNIEQDPVSLYEASGSEYGDYVYAGIPLAGE